jgi:hypothetical protein
VIRDQQKPLNFDPVKLGTKPTQVDGVPELWALNLDPEATAREYRERVVGPYRKLLPPAAVTSMEEQLSGATVVPRQGGPQREPVDAVVQEETPETRKPRPPLDDQGSGVAGKGGFRSPSRDAVVDRRRTACKVGLIRSR